MSDKKTIRRRNPPGYVRVARIVTARAATILGLGVLLLSMPAPASAHARVFVGGVFGFPGPYPYPYAYPYYYPYPAPYPWAYPDTPPPGWVPGRWEWRSDQWGRRYPAWIPAHLQ